jgi:4-aminobutyrate aminotransferase-like enzyme
MSTSNLDHSEFDQLVQQLVQGQKMCSSSVREIRAADPAKSQEYAALMQDFAQVRGRPLFYEYVGSGRGAGPYVELMDGSVKLDFINGIGVHIFGHAHPRVLEASVKASLSDILMQGHLQMNQEYLDFSQTVIDLAQGSRLKHGWICPSGSMANENALKMARQKNTPARFIIAMKDSFAGRTTMMAEVTDNPNYKVGLPEYHEVLRIPFYDKEDLQSSQKTLDALKAHIAAHPGDISCFYFEPMLGEGVTKWLLKSFLFHFLKSVKNMELLFGLMKFRPFSEQASPLPFKPSAFPSM